MKRIIRFLKKYKQLQTFNAIWKSLAVYPAYSAMNKVYSRIISQWTGKEIRNVVKAILPGFAISLRRPSAVQCTILNYALTCVQLIVDFTVTFPMGKENVMPKWAVVARLNKVQIKSEKDMIL